MPSYGLPSVNGASSRNDDLFVKGKPLDEKLGYLGDTEHIKAGGVNESGSPDYSPDGGGYAVVNGWQQAGTSAFDKDVKRFRSAGEQSHARGAVQLDQQQANESRGLQMGALGMMGDAARGNAPSRAAEVGAAGSEDAIRSAGLGMLGGTSGNRDRGRGPGAAIAAAAEAQNAAQGQMTRLGGNVSDMRAQEMSTAQNAYAKGTQGVQGQDIQAASMNAQLEAQQRAMNEARQQAMERRGWDVRNQQQMAADRYQRNRDSQELARRKQAAAEGAQDDAAVEAGVSSFLGAAQMASDERTKQSVMPMGSLSSIGRGRR